MARKPKVEAEEAAPMLSLIDSDTPEGGALVVMPDADPAEQAKAAAALIYVDPVRFDQFYERMREETAKHVPDVTTAAGRDAIRSLAFRVTKTKTSLDKAGLELTADWRARVKAVNDARGPIVSRLAALADEVRQPLTEWEAVEAARVAANESVLAGIRTAATVTPEDTALTVEERGRTIWATTFPADTWLPEEIEAGEAAKAATVQALVAARNRLKQEEADRAELEELRKERAAREEREAAAKAERDRIAAEEEAERQRVAAAEQAERDRLAAIKAEEDRVEKARQEAAEQARREAEEARERERQAEREEHERQRVAAEEREREAAAERARQANRAHRSNVQRAVKEALMTCGIDEEQAKKVVLAIVAGNVPHCEVKF